MTPKKNPPELASTAATAKKQRLAASKSMNSTRDAVDRSTNRKNAPIVVTPVKGKQNKVSAEPTKAEMNAGPVPTTTENMGMTFLDTLRSTCVRVDHSSEATAGNASATAAAAGDDDDHTGAGDVDGDVDNGFLHYDPDPNATTVAISLWERKRANTGAGVSRAQDVKLLGHKNESLPMVTVKMNNEDKLVAPNRILTARIQPHIAIIMFYLPKNDDRSPTIHYVLQALQDHPGAWEHFCRDCNVHMVAKLRDENNPMKPQNCNRTGGLATREWPCLVGFRTKQWTAQILKTWAKKVAHKLQSVAHIKCRYPLPLEYAGDITPPIIQVLSYYLTVQDVLEALEQRIFPGMTLANILEQQDMTVYFDNKS